MHQNPEYWRQSVKPCHNSLDQIVRKGGTRENIVNYETSVFLQKKKKECSMKSMFSFKDYQLC